MAGPAGATKTKGPENAQDTGVMSIDELNARLSGATKIEAIKMPPVNKIRQEYSKGLSHAADAFVKELRSKLEEKEGVPSNPRMVELAKLTRFWSEENGKIEDIAGFTAKVTELLKEITLELPKNLAPLMEAVGTGYPSTKITVPETVEKTGEAPGAVMALMDAFGRYYNREKPDAMIGFGKPDGDTMTALGKANRDGEEFETAGVFLIWRGKINLARDEKIL